MSWFGATLLAMTLAGVLTTPTPAREGWPTARLGGAHLELEVVSSPEDRYRGLSGRQGLAPGRGMAFVYPRPRSRCMVMRDMRFGLDIIWLREGVVVGLARRVPPPGPGQEPREACSPQAVDLVLEVPAGWAEDNRIRLGDRLLFPPREPGPRPGGR